MADKFHRYSQNLLVLDNYIPYRLEVVRYLELIRTTHAGRTLFSFLANSPRKKTVRIIPFKPTTDNPVNANASPDAKDADEYTRNEPQMDPVNLGPMRVMLPSLKWTGTGLGSEVTVRYHPANQRQYYMNTGGTEPGSGPGEVLFHELIHAMRMAWGKYLRSNVFEHMHMDDFEEFCAILAANMYRSERGFKQLRLDHRTNRPLDKSMANPATYYRFFERPIKDWFKSQKDFCLELAASKAEFNPLKYAANDLGYTVRTPMALK